MNKDSYETRDLAEHLIKMEFERQRRYAKRGQCQIKKHPEANRQSGKDTDQRENS